MCCLLKLHKKWFNGSMAVKKPYITKGKHVVDPKHIVNAVKAHLELLHK